MVDNGLLVDAVELAYDATLPDAVWLRRVLDTLARALAPRGVEAWFCEPVRAPLVIEAADALTLFACDLDGRGAILQLHQPATTLPLEQLERFTTHLIAAYRMRRGGGGMEAVLTPEGKLCHAEGEAIVMREELREAARTIHRARTRLRASAPDDALAAWRVLVEARWSLVDVTDSDGKRLVIARVNTPRLVTRAQHIIALAARGHSNRLIAYQLGLSEGLVTAFVATALQKLNACA